MCLMRETSGHGGISVITVVLVYVLPSEVILEVLQKGFLLL